MFCQYNMLNPGVCHQSAYCLPLKQNMGEILCFKVDFVGSCVYVFRLSFLLPLHPKPKNLENFS